MKWPCALQPCDLPALRVLHGQCEICYRHFCAKHVVSRLHTCPTEEDIHSIYSSGDPARFQHLNSIRRTAGEKMISGLLETINRDAFCARAEILRDGFKCTLDLPTANKAYFNFDVLGGCNYHGSIIFEDGKTWLARFRLPNHNEPPLQERNFDRRSEFATYRFLAETAIPVPEVYEVADDDDSKNPVGAGYILLEKLPGKPLAWHNASEAQKENFSRQLADIYINLEQHPFDKLGRLQISPTGLLEVGPAFFDYDSTGKLISFGPFCQSNDYYTAMISRQIMLTKNGEIATSEPLDLYLIYMTLLDHLPPNEPSTFFLRHVDSRDSNFLVDEEYNITGIIDWELAIVTSKSSAFQSPSFYSSRSEVKL